MIQRDADVIVPGMELHWSSPRIEITSVISVAEELQVYVQQSLDTTRDSVLGSVAPAPH
jgi:hypothetical protein